jgi:hypothetical protein
MIGPIDSLSKEPSNTFRATAMSSLVRRLDGWKILRPARSCLCTSVEISDSWAIVGTEVRQWHARGQEWTIYIPDQCCGDGLEGEQSFEKHSFRA